MSTIAEAAAAALAAERAEREAFEQQMRDTLVGVVRQTVTDRLAPLDAAALDVAHVDTTAYIAVLTDGVICLAGTDDGEVYLVNDDAGWTRKSPRLRSLAHLGEVLSGEASGGVS